MRKIATTGRLRYVRRDDRAHSEHDHRPPSEGAHRGQPPDGAPGRGAQARRGHRAAFDQRARKQRREAPAEGEQDAGPQRPLPVRQRQKVQKLLW